MRENKKPSSAQGKRRHELPLGKFRYPLLRLCPCLQITTFFVPPKQARQTCPLCQNLIFIYTILYAGWKGGKSKFFRQTCKKSRKQ
jgi:hypothetical protein